MRRALPALWIAALVLGARPTAAVQTRPELWVSAVRFYRPDKKQTMVKVLVQVPYASNGYTMAVRVTDSTGQTIQQQSWAKRTLRSVRPGSCGLELLDFALAPGKHRLEVAVTDSSAGTRAEAAMDLVGFSEPPPASDLMLAPLMRAATEADTVPRSGELRRGNILIAATAHPTITPERSQVYYLLEVYSTRPDSGTLVVGVADSAGQTLGRTPPSSVRLDAGGAVLRSHIDLGGLAPGEYTLAVELQIDGGPIWRSAAFSVLGPEAGTPASCQIRD